MPPPLGPCDQQTGMRLDERRRRFPGARRLRSQSGGGPGRGAPAEAQRVVCEQLHPGVQQHVGRVAEPRAGRVLARAAGADRRARQRAQRAQRAAVAAAAARRRRALEARRAVHRRRGRQRPGGAAHCSACLFASLHQVPKAPLAKRVTSPTQCHRPVTRGEAGAHVSATPPVRGRQLTLSCALRAQAGPRPVCVAGHAPLQGMQRFTTSARRRARAHRQASSSSPSSSAAARASASAGGHAHASAAGSRRARCASLAGCGPPGGAARGNTSPSSAHSSTCRRGRAGACRPSQLALHGPGRPALVRIVFLGARPLGHRIRGQLLPLRRRCAASAPGAPPSHVRAVSPHMHILAPTGKAPKTGWCR